ncbi:TetR/AcrR family transcriptional regulator [Actinoplanes awajinensis]|uniref:TetR family transcriptional regulator n=1 Tax=Actinoplanes awajinensis subsp. mycoplanecinus TaxID=135947 RepID=A0A101J7J0_9ACTN|nr:TetR/AcrR family transcriptional regulator [Actinoplanes awajinensis]KUL21675.1 TetR family transcriptional regulator [Actinoplanes awajinensis subsp. mycoplanecinus]
MSLRDRKRARTRQALVAAATELFESRGYDETTIADIASAAEIGTRTFFSYFPSKEDLLFPEVDLRVHAAVDAIAVRGPADGPAEVLLRALQKVGEDSDDLAGRLAALRLHLVRTVPAVRGRGLQLQLDAQREIARHLAAAFPDQIDEVGAAALTGAFVGAVMGALQVLLEDLDRSTDPAAVQQAVQVAVGVALTPWFRTGPPPAD